MTGPALSTAPPSFIDRDAAAVERDIIAQFETLLGRTLQPAQIERVLVDVITYREMLLRLAIQDAAEQNTLAFARGARLDFLAEIVGASRLPARPATATLRFTLAAAQGVAITIAAGTVVSTADRQAQFATTAGLEIPAGETFGDVVALATVPGIAGNGYLAGAIAALSAPISLVSAVANLGVTVGGADPEQDDALRARVQLAPNQFSVAGSAEAYQFHALSVSPSIVSVAVTSPIPGIVHVTVLTNTGLPSDDLLEQVRLALSDEKIRPLTDRVYAVAPTRVAYTIDATVRLYRSADLSTTTATVAKAAAAYALDRRQGLGRDVVPSQIVAALSVPGAYAVTLAAPAQIDVGDTEWADCTAITIVIGDPADG